MWGAVGSWVKKNIKTGSDGRSEFKEWMKRVSTQRSPRSSSITTHHFWVVVLPPLVGGSEG
jgi:hypothetical protein